MPPFRLPHSMSYAVRSALAALFAFSNLALTLSSPAPSPALLPAAVTPAWHNDTIYFEGRSAHVSAVDIKAAEVHIAFFEDDTARVRYAHWGGTSQDWQWVEVAQRERIGGPITGELDVAVDGDQQAHIVYEDDNKILYAYGDEGGFQVELLAGGNIPQVSTTEVGPVVTFLPSIHGSHDNVVTLAARTASTWNYQAIFSQKYIVWQSLALDSSQRVHVAVGGSEMSPFNQIHYVTQSGSAWVNTLVGQGYNPAIATDSLHNPRIAYSDAGFVRYASLVNGSWVTEMVAPAVDVLEADDVKPALAFGLADRPHVAFVDGQGLKYGYRDGGGWHVSLVSQTTTTSYAPGDLGHAGLAVDAAGNPHLSFQDPALHAVHAALEPAWHTTIADGRAPVAYTAIDASYFGQPRISYAALGGSHRGLNYAEYGELICAPPSCLGSWNRLPVALGNGVDRGYYSNIALRDVVHGDPRVASYSPAPADLEYSFRTETFWTTETVDSAGDVGRYADLEMDATGQPWIAYWDNTHFRVRLGWKDPAGWHVVTDTVGPPLDAQSGYLSLALPLPASGLCCAYITYYDGVNDDLRLAVWNGSAWTDTLVAGAGDAGSLNALDFTMASGNTPGELWSVFYVAGTQTLRLADLLDDSPTYSVTLLTAPAPLIELSELTAYNHNSGLQAIAYTTSGDNVLHVAHGSFSQWATDPVDSGSPSRRYPSLDFSRYRLHLSYAGPAGELMYGVSAKYHNYSVYNPLRPCFDAPEQALQALAAAPRAFTPLSPAGAGAAGDLDLLRATRDLFATDPDGQHLITLYYTHAAETGALAVTDPDLALEAFNVLHAYFPGLRALVSGEGWRVVVTTDMVDQANHLADRLAAAGSPALAADIAAERGAYHHLQDFSGLTFAEAAARIGVPIPTRLSLPLLRR